MFVCLYVSLCLCVVVCFMCVSMCLCILRGCFIVYVC